MKCTGSCWEIKSKCLANNISASEVVDCNAKAQTAGGTQTDSDPGTSAGYRLRTACVDY